MKFENMVCSFELGTRAKMLIRLIEQGLLNVSENTI